ncbi:hypothetical protein COO60DRAFT_656563 [Scenedesmus sp. NREL 46B-D3]|nr:hypothetical protein COO60DRAFT_656563 [Scenedesmus sp. NREL 46B-D3]
MQGCACTLLGPVTGTMKLPLSMLMLAAQQTMPRAELCAAAAAQSGGGTGLQAWRGAAYSCGCHTAVASHTIFNMAYGDPHAPAVKHTSSQQQLHLQLTSDQLPCCCLTPPDHRAAPRQVLPRWAALCVISLPSCHAWPTQINCLALQEVW